MDLSFSSLGYNIVYIPQVRTSRFSRKLLLVTYLTSAQQTGLAGKK